MIQTVTQNSTLSQNWDECTPKAQVARTLPCRIAHWAVSWPPSGRVAGVSCRVAARCSAVSRAHSAVSRAPCHILSPCPLSRYKTSYRDTRVHVARVAALLLRIMVRCCVISQRRVVAPQSRYKNCIATHPVARPRARALPLAPARRSALSWPLVGRIVGPCRRAIGCIMAPLLRAPTHLCHDTTYCTVTQTGKWAIAHPVSPA